MRDHLNEGIKILLIEDEPIWIEAMSMMLEDFGFELVNVADNFDQAVRFLNEGNFDIVLLDIKIKGKNDGLLLGNLAAKMNEKPFIFITGSFDSHTLNDASMLNPSAYLVKPPNPASLFIAIQNAIGKFENKSVNSTETKTDVPEFLFVKQGNKYKKLEWMDIVSLQSDKNYTILFNSQDKKKYSIRGTLPKTLQWILPESFKSKFIQVNRTEVLQLKFIEEVTGDNITTKFGNFTIGEQYSKNLRQKLNIKS